ncbi:capsular polysaccharide export protein [Bisgaardia hudsonensis]|uniref:Capsular polysaccharide export protein n=1 Tax=Bisgaardia hudsonensis TaxID=109472 RepID=A0A4R2N373_9PAST|nr:capsular polysaccharide biosynthesis protein [Bisgaardia hudsonensis]QLB12712.1 capsule biosynthesis protein [Bisgaardia hudsonensis]TCP14262.1 capsular polysaccharide export protein [Bisgaardia hudsonensis]
MLNGLIFSQGILKIPNIQNFLPEYDIRKFSNKNFQYTYGTHVIGWGFRPSATRAREFAKSNKLRYVALEDGFLRSLGLGVDGYPPYSIVYDDVGIYYDTKNVSRLEKLILENNISYELLEQAEQAIQLILKHKLSKYNHTLDFSLVKDDNGPVVLVIDQTYNDMAVKYGQADSSHFNQMLEAAIKENPSHKVWVKTHPDVLTGKKKGYLTNLDKYKNVRIITDDINPQILLQDVDKVYCVTSQMGFEALLAGKNVVTFGVPWFAGWGNTDDRHPNVEVLKWENRRTKHSVKELFCVAYLQYARYICPYSGDIGNIFQVIDYLQKVKTLNQQFAGNIYCVGMSFWKKNVVKPFLNFPQTKLHFVSSFKRLKKQPISKLDKLLLWGNGSEELLVFSKENQIPILRMEDGFIRSVGLGSNLVSPLSLVIDDIGIYFNAKNPSRLEHILAHTKFTSFDLRLAKLLQEELIVSNIGKYNVGRVALKIDIPDNKKIILVPGQVENDASICLGSPDIKSNLELLKRVRTLNTDSYIIYKPHPDVLTGNRKGHISKAEILRYADQIVEKVNVLDCINRVDEVHTMTSLAGFEALLRNKKVYCYGLPFYSNWGLTEDLINLPRRQKKLTLLELIAGTMIYYPQYINPETGQIIDVLQGINILKKQKESLATDGFQRSWIGKQIGKLQQLIRVIK